MVRTVARPVHCPSSIRDDDPDACVAMVELCLGRTISDFFTLAVPVILVGILVERRDRAEARRSVLKATAAAP